MKYLNRLRDTRNCMYWTAPTQGAITHYREALNPAETLYIVSTKSGGTVETLSLMKYFYTETANLLGADFAGDHFIAITDPGSGLEEMAGKLKFKKIFLNDPNIGGRYSVLTMFGLVPAALIGIDIGKLLDTAIATSEQSKNNDNTNTSACLGTVMGTFAAAGRDKLTLITSPQLSHFGIWLEQLVAESVGKEGKGILPVDNEPYLGIENYRNDRLFVYLQLADDCSAARHASDVLEAGYPLILIRLRDVFDLGAEFFRWEFATAIAGAVLNVQPFDQPNVESAKVAAKKVIAEYQKSGVLPKVKFRLNENGIFVATDQSGAKINAVLESFFEDIQTGRDYISLQAYITPTPESEVLLQQLRTAFSAKYKVATTLGYGPRFLHSTGQLHKGDAGHGYFVQIVSHADKDIAIPDAAGKNESAMNFDVLKNAQSMGDRPSLVG